MIKIKPAYWSCGFPLEVIFFVFFFYFLSELFRRIITSFEYNPSFIAILFKTTLTSDGGNWGLFGFFYIFLNILVGKYLFLQKWSMNNFIYWSPCGFLFLAMFSTSTFIVSWYSKVLWYYSIEIIMSLLSSSILFAFSVTLSSAFASSASYYSASCKNMDIFHPWSWLLNFSTS